MRGVVVVAVVLAPALAAAAPARTARLDVSGTCELRDITARANELAGRDAITPDGAALISVATSEVDGGGIAATIVLSDEQHVTQPLRAVSATTCAELAATVAIVISLVVQQDPAPAVPLPAAPVVPPPPPVVVPLTVTEVVPRAVVPPPPMLLDVGLGRATNGELSAVVGATRAWYGAELQLASAGADADYGHADMTIVRLAAGACYRRGRFGACGLGVAGLVRGHSRELMFPESATRPLAGVAARVEWRQPLGPSVGLRLYLDATQLVATARFLLDDVVVWSTPERSATVGAGMFFRLP